MTKLAIITSDDALALKRLPKSLIILGGGAIACEFAQFFARFGVKVTLIQRSEHILKEFDADAAVEIEKVFRREGIRVFTGTKLVDAKRKGKLKTVSFEHEGKTISVSAEEILFALGRVPNTASLDLENAGVKTENGRIIANEFMQTSAPHIYAAGDCTGPHEIVHIAVQQGEIAAHNIANPDSAAPDGLPAVDFGRVHRAAGGVRRPDGKGGDRRAGFHFWRRAIRSTTTANRSSWRRRTVL